MSEVSRRNVLLGGAAALGGTAGIGLSAGASARPATAGLPVGAPQLTSSGEAVTVTPSDARYADMVHGSNRRWTGSPERIRVVQTTQQVVDAVQDAVRARKRLSVRSGGHCYEDFVYNADVEVVIDLSVMRAVYYDDARRAFVVEAGATLYEVYLELYRSQGVTIPGGSCGSVGAGGHICGGGFGLLSRLHGLTVDHVYGVEVVVVDQRGRARSVVATRDEGDPNRDLWWAHTGGGGGNFGIVTRYFLRTPGTENRPPSEQLPKPPGQVYSHSLSWDWADMTQSRFRTLLKNFGTWHEANSSPGSPYAGLHSSLALNTAASGEISMSTQIEASTPGAAQRLDAFISAVSAGLGAPRPMRVRAGEQAARPEFFVPQAVQWYQSIRSSGGGGSWSRCSDYKSTYMLTGFPDDQIATIYRHLTNTENASDLLQVSSYGCEINAVQPGATAAAHRNSILKLQYQNYWSDPAEEAGKVAWLREFYRDVYRGTGGVPVSNGVTDGCYVNYPDVDLNDPQWNTSGVPWHDLYYKENYPRLQQVKRRWDPTDTFRHTQSVRLPGAV
ncbi:FAD-binding protein [Micromonospora sp. NPDC023737]|uniref:FAD-dependent oxidoreductase n=1 Tax=unclassified Micromonospora TaxID=2617518 RepID=UPI0033E49A8F